MIRGKCEGFEALVKEADQTNNTDTFVSDSLLTFPVLALQRYLFRFLVFFDTTAAGDFKIQLTGPASPTRLRVLAESLAPSGTALAATVWTSFSSALAITGAGTTGGIVRGYGALQNGVNAGSVTIQWAQNAADAGPTKVLIGSILEWSNN